MIKSDMRSSKYLSWILSAVLLGFLGVAVYFSAKVLTVRAQATQVLKLTPYVIERWTISYAKDTRGRLETVKVYERTGDGKYAEKTVKQDYSVRRDTPIRKVQLPSGIQSEICDSCQLRSTVRMAPDDLATFKYGFTRTICDQYGAKLVGQDTVAGHQVEVRQLVRTTETGTSRVTLESATDLGCAVLRLAEEQDHSDGKFSLMFEEVAKSVVLAEPPSGDFDIPQSYQEVHPSDLYFMASPALRSARDNFAPPDSCAKDSMHCKMWQKAQAAMSKADLSYDQRRMR